MSRSQRRSDPQHLALFRRIVWTATYDGSARSVRGLSPDDEMYFAEELFSAMRGYVETGPTDRELLYTCNRIAGAQAASLGRPDLWILERGRELFEVASAVAAEAVGSSDEIESVHGGRTRARTPNAPTRLPALRGRSLDEYEQKLAIAIADVLDESAGPKLLFTQANRGDAESVLRGAAALAASLADSDPYYATAASRALVEEFVPQRALSDRAFVEAVASQVVERARRVKAPLGMRVKRFFSSR